MTKLHVSLQVETDHTPVALLTRLRELLEDDGVTVVQNAAVRHATPAVATYKREHQKSAQVS